MQYRADIDGLRAIAILPVILFHAGLESFSGGFVGVDIFFVISGFLITTIIYNKIRQGNFSLVYFYDRRARRILPALFFMLAIVSVAAWFFLLPNEYVSYSKSLFSTTIFSSNFYFWLTADYFDSAAESKPLLHTWSLAVEEQYYIFFPIFLAFIIASFKRHIHLILWTIFILSFALSVIGVFYKPVMTFYLAPTRAWELLFGSLLAVGSISPPKNKQVQELLGIIGFSLIVVSIMVLDENSTFPGLNALAPCLGTLMIIMAGMGQRKSIVNSILALRLPVFIGQLSYPLYLWHWPLLVFAKLILPDQLNSTTTFLVLLVSTIFSYFSMRLVEQPFRQKKVCVSTRSILTFSTTLLLIFAIFGLHGISNDGIPQRFPNFVMLQQSLEKGEITQPDQKGCWFLSQNHSDVLENCSYGSSDSKNRVMLWGDSHARSLLPAFDTLGKEYDHQIIVASLAGCPPVIEVTRPDGYDNAPKCKKHSEIVMNFIRDNDIKRIFIVARWGLYTHGWYRNGKLQKATGFLADELVSETGPLISREVLHRKLTKTVGIFKDLNIPVVLITGIPVQKSEPQRLYRLQELYDSFEELRLEEHLEHQRVASELLFDLEDPSRVDVLDTTSVTCGQIYCPYRDESRLFYKDDNHISPQRAIELIPLLRKYF